MELVCCDGISCDGNLECIMCGCGYGGDVGDMVFKYNIIEEKYGNKIRGMKIVCGVGETNSDFFRSDLLKKIKTTPPYAIFKDKKIK